MNGRRRPTVAAPRAQLELQRIGELEDDVGREGRWWNVLTYELTQPEWTDVSTTMRVNRSRLP